MHGYLRHLANFAYIVDAGSLSAASKTLESTPSAMSESVRILEAHLGSPLLERHQRGVSPTPLGERVHAQAQRVVQALNAALAPDDAQRLRGPLRISLPGELANNGLEHGLVALAQAHRDVQLETYIEDAVLDYSKFARDLYVRASHLAQHDGLTTLAQAKTRVVLVGSASLFQTTDPSTLDGWRAQTLLSSKPRKGSPTLPFVDPQSGQSTDVTLARRLIVSDAASRVQAVRAGLGVAVCLAAAVQHDLADGRLVEASPLFEGPTAYITVGSPHQRPPEVMREVAEALLQPLQTTHPSSEL